MPAVRHTTSPSSGRASRSASGARSGSRVFTVPSGWSSRRAILAVRQPFEYASSTTRRCSSGSAASAACTSRCKGHPGTGRLVGAVVVSTSCPQRNACSHRSAYATTAGAAAAHPTRGSGRGENPRHERTAACIVPVDVAPTPAQTRRPPPPLPQLSSCIMRGTTRFQVQTTHAPPTGPADRTGSPSACSSRPQAPNSVRSASRT